MGTELVVDEGSPCLQSNLWERCCVVQKGVGRGAKQCGPRDVLLDAGYRMGKCCVVERNGWRVFRRYAIPC